MDGSLISKLAISFLAGFLNFLFPCILSIVPVQIAYLAGLGGKNPKRRGAFVNGIYFVLGFLAVFILLGLTVNTLARVLAPWRKIILQIGGAFFIFVGLSVLGVFRAAVFQRTFMVKPGNWLGSLEKPRSFLMGATFGFSWSPCIGPVLALILFWVSYTANFWQGALLLFAFGLGMAVPFLILSLFIDKISPYLFKIGRVTFFLEIIFGLFIIFVGVLLLTNRLGALFGLATALQQKFLPFFPFDPVRNF